MICECMHPKSCLSHAAFAAPPQKLRLGTCSNLLQLFNRSDSLSLKDALLLTNPESTVGATVTVQGKQ